MMGRKPELCRPRPQAELLNDPPRGLAACRLNAQHLPQPRQKQCLHPRVDRPPQPTSAAAFPPQPSSVAMRPFPPSEVAPRSELGKGFPPPGFGTKPPGHLCRLAVYPAAAPPPEAKWVLPRVSRDTRSRTLDRLSRPGIPLEDGARRRSSRRPFPTTFSRAESGPASRSSLRSRNGEQESPGKPTSGMSPGYESETLGRGPGKKKTHRAIYLRHQSTRPTIKRPAPSATRRNRAQQQSQKRQKSVGGASPGRRRAEGTRKRGLLAVSGNA